VACDEDEESNASASIFFYDGASLKDAGGFYVTAKSNGENAKMGCLVADGVPYLLAGSKNTCYIWPAEDPYSKHGEANNPKVPAQFICLLYSHFYLNLTAEQKREFVELMTTKYGTIMGEINTPWYEHVVPINDLFMETYTLLDARGRPVHPKTSFDFFKHFGIDQRFKTISVPPPEKSGVPSPDKLQEFYETKSQIKMAEAGYPLDAKQPYVNHVYFSSHSIQDLDGVINSIRDAKNTEGAVLYLTDAKSDRVIGLVKVKASEYVLRRRIRENLKGALFSKLSRGEVKEFPVRERENNKVQKKEKSPAKILPLKSHVRIVKDRIHKGARALTHVPGCKEHWEEWAAFGRGFAEWWVSSRLLNGTNPEQINIDYVLKEAKGRIASLFAAYASLNSKK